MKRIIIALIIALTIVTFASLITGCSKPKGDYWIHRWDGPPHEIGETVYLKGEYETSWVVHEIKGDKALVARTVIKKENGFVFGGRYSEVQREEFPLATLVRKVSWKNGEPEPIKRK